MSATRYDRQTRLEGFGPEAQARLAGASVVIIGAGGLGVPCALYLNAMGVGRLGLVDGDHIELSNLHRQPIYTTEDLGKPKVQKMSAFLRLQNPETRLVSHDTYLHASNALEILEGFDLVVDATDNLTTRYLIDDACIMLSKPWVYGALHGFEGQVSVFNRNGGPTYRCLFPKMPAPGEVPNCNQLGTLGVLPGIIGNLQALEAVKVLCGLDGILSGKLLLYQALDQQVRIMRFERDPERQMPENLLQENYTFGSCDPEDGEVPMKSFLHLHQAPGDHLLVDVREPEEYETIRIPGAINIPLGGLKSRADSLAGRSAVYFICQSGPRSYRAYQTMRKRYPGQRIYWITGGMRQYKIEIS